MREIKTIYIINTIISGCIAALIAGFFAAGTIAENYTDETWIAPEFFVVIPIWAIGALIGLLTFTKFFFPKLFLFASIIVTWGAIPWGLEIGRSLAT
ncbi:hypothetical protein [Halobacillus naozhouensis]|uniref:Uncharacterized protein n=1 Tax=Halobacillus naozhouensis TaxID=554880 RepID=A0ABY8IYB0_9BACI|nr:hypothetical protein [Halobacillus naozhouensis]WFT74169.1 hypothetical protein P9989_17660 [Halobacillus naozhouensis]